MGPVVVFVPIRFYCLHVVSGHVAAEEADEETGRSQKSSPGRGFGSRWCSKTGLIVCSMLGAAVTYPKNDEENLCSSRLNLQLDPSLVAGCVLSIGRNLHGM